MLICAQRKGWVITEYEVIERWIAKKRSALIVSIQKGEISAQEAAHKHDLAVAELEEWKEKFLGAGENALRSPPKDEEGLKNEQIKRLKEKVGELVLDVTQNNLLAMRMKRGRTLRTSRRIRISAWMSSSR